MVERRPRRARALVVLVASVLLAGAILIALSVRARRRAPRIAEGSHAFPTGGAASARSQATATTTAGDASPADLLEDGHRHEIRAFRFALADHELALEDARMERALDAILERTGAELVVNGGFFDPDGKAVGYALSRGAVLARHSKVASGGVLTVAGGHAVLHEAETFVLPEGATFGVQCKPRLVVKGTANVRRDDGKRSERTALCLRNGGATLEVIVARAAADSPREAPGPSLFALAQHLALRGCEDALNLDGGPSTGFAARRADGSVEASLPRGGVRHAIVIRRR